MGYMTEDTRWFIFYPKFSSAFYLEKAGYFDERPEITTSVTQLLVLFMLPFLLVQSLWFLLLLPFVLFGWGTLYLYLPIKTGIQDAESAGWGFNYHGDTFWIYTGASKCGDGKGWVTINMPWQMTWVRTSTLLSDDKWFHKDRKNRLNWGTSDYGSYNWLQRNRWLREYDYTDKCDGTVVKATIGVSEREWRPIAFKWTCLFAKVRRSIDVDFSEEVGKGKGSYKGGVLGCGYDLLPNESPKACLLRMQEDKNF